MMARFNFKGIGTSNIFIVYFPKLLDIDTLIKFLSIYLKVAISLLAYILDIDTLIKFLFIYLKVATSLLAYISYQYPNSA